MLLCLPITQSSLVHHNNTSYMLFLSLVDSLTLLSLGISIQSHSLHRLVSSMISSMLVGLGIRYTQDFLTLNFDFLSDFLCHLSFPLVTCLERF
jgi:hypothetical protein